MTRIYAILTALVLALFVGACESNTNDPDTGIIDTDGPIVVVGVYFGATLNTYGWDGDEVVLESSEDIDKAKGDGYGATYVASNGDEVIDGTTADFRDLVEDVWFVEYEFQNYLGFATADVADTADLSASLCADLSGDWICDDGMHEDPIETIDAVMNGCSIQINGIAVGNDWLEIDGNMISDVGPEGSTIDGIVSSDSIVMILDRSDGFTCDQICNRI